MNLPWQVHSAGAAAGEAGLATAFVRSARSRGHAVHAWTVLDEHAAMLREAGATVEAPKDPRRVLEAMARASVLVCATSLTCHRVFPFLPRPGPLLVTLESSWLPWARTADGRLARVDAFLVAMPPPVFTAGLAARAGRFAIAEEILPRVRPTGWFAEESRRVGAPTTVLLYFGRGYDPAGLFCGAALRVAIEEVGARRPGITWRYVGPPGLRLPSFVQVVTQWVDERSMARCHADADLVICHHGQVTIGRAAAAGVPVLALADGAIFRPGVEIPWADYEIHCFARAGVVEAVHGSPPPGALARRIECLLDEGPRPPSGGGGAEMAVRMVEELLAR